MNRYRHEYKYLLNTRQETILLTGVPGILMRDSHVEANGSYLIRSLYFDDYSDSCYFENESGTDSRSKFRIRYYNNVSSQLHLEKKSKIRGMIKKEMCLLNQEEYQILLKGNIPTITLEMPEPKKKLFLEMHLRQLVPKVIVTYERIPFVYHAGNVRITFDRKLSSSTDVMNFLSGDYPVRPVFPLGGSLLEVKWDQLLPPHIKDFMKLNTLQWTSFSKYYMCRQYHL
ncbi:MAG: polyphosphate polymerase domain-containing protein [Lachnospiraceae bacterium]|nr:polyphosphate polymerase domain-containing protein [Lachnospiraceae bacterium]